MPKPSEVTECRIVGRLGKPPETTTTQGGTTVCRMVVVKKADGHASSPVEVGLYAKGDLAARCGSKLGEGDLIEAFGPLGRQRARARRPELVTEDVKLWERAEGSGAP